MMQETLVRKKMGAPLARATRRQTAPPLLAVGAMAGMAQVGAKGRARATAGGDTAARESSDEKDALEIAADSLEPGDTLEDMETLEKRVNGGMMTLNTDVFPTTEAFLQALRSDPPVCFVHETTPRGVRGINNKGAHPLADMLSQKSGAAPGFGSNFFLSITSLTAIVAAVNHSLRRLLAPRNQGKTAYLVVYVDKDKVAFDPTVVFGDTYTFG